MREARGSLSEDIFGGYLAAVVATGDVVLYRRLGQLESYVAKESVLLGAEVPNDVRVGVGLAQERHLTVRKREAVG